MKKLIMATLMALFFIPLTTKAYEKGEGKVQEADSKATKEIIYLCSAVAVLSVLAGVVYKGYSKGEDEYSIMLQNAEMYELAEAYKTEIRSIQLIVEDAKSFKIQGKSQLEDLLFYASSILPADEGLEATKTFVESYEGVQTELLNFMNGVVAELRKYEAAVEFINDFRKKDYIGIYSDSASENFKPVFNSIATDIVLENTLKNYRAAIMKNIELRGTLIMTIDAGKADDLFPILVDLNANLDEINDQHARYQRIKERDAECVLIAKHAKQVVRQRAETLLSYCDDPSVPADMRNTTRTCILETMEGLIQFTEEDLSLNYALYQKLMHELTLCEAPYRVAMAKENQTEEEISL